MLYISNIYYHKYFNQTVFIEEVPFGGNFHYGYQVAVYDKLYS